MAESACTRCGEPLAADRPCPRCAREQARVGDATRGRIERLADGWALPVRDDRVGDAHIVREVRTESDLSAPPRAATPRAAGKRSARPSPTDRAVTAKAADVGSVLAALEQELDDDGGDEDLERGTDRRPPLVHDQDDHDDAAEGSLLESETEPHELIVALPVSGPRAQTLLADDVVEAALDPANDDDIDDPDDLDAVDAVDAVEDLDAVDDDGVLDDEAIRTEPQQLVTPLPGPAPTAPPRPSASPRPTSPWTGATRGQASESNSIYTPIPAPSPSMTEPWEKLEVGRASGTPPPLPDARRAAPRRTGPPPLPALPPARSPLALGSSVTGPESPALAELGAGPRAAQPADATVFDPRSPIVDTSAPVITAPLAVRRTGVWGDVRYAFAVVRGLVAGRRELTTMKERLALERAGRKRRLIDAARVAVGEEAITGETIDDARERLAWHEEQRAQYVAAAQAAEEEAKRAEEERAEEQRETARRLAELDKALEGVEARLRPLEKDMGERKKEVETLRAQVHAATKRLDGIERRLAAAKDGVERAGVEAELAAMRAEKLLLAGEEPARQAAVLALVPRIDAEGAERKRLLAEVQATKERAVATEARLTAVAKDARMRRDREQVAQQGSETARDAELVQLGQSLDANRPAVLKHRFRAVDEHTAAIAQLERRAFEIEAAAASVDGWALARGMGLVILTLLIVALVLGFVLR